jgi:hypothetical protein
MALDVMDMVAVERLVDQKIALLKKEMFGALGRKGAAVTNSLHSHEEHVAWGKSGGRGKKKVKEVYANGGEHETD